MCGDSLTCYLIRRCRRNKLVSWWWFRLLSCTRWDQMQLRNSWVPLICMHAPAGPVCPLVSHPLFLIGWRWLSLGAFCCIDLVILTASTMMDYFKMHVTFSFRLSYFLFKTFQNAVMRLFTDLCIFTCRQFSDISLSSV